MASSRLIVAGEYWTPDDVNNLRADVLDPSTGHKHNGTDGARVPFSYLDTSSTFGSTAPYGGTKSYDQIEAHVGSSQDVHSLGQFGHVAGAISQGLVMQVGTISGAVGHVTFARAYTSAPLVFVSINNAPGSQQDWPAHASAGYRNVTPTGFDVNSGYSGSNQIINSCSWMAIGVLA